MIYTAAIDQINWSDIVAFCEERRTENSYLDYKKDFSTKLDKTIASMANTVGGLILIGVDEDEESKPVLPISGIEATEKLEERVTNIILDNILPPVFPEIRVCRDESKERAIVLIRIQQSEQSPHAIAKNTSVYLRTGNVTKPEDLAEVDKIDWLKNRREKSETLRKAVFARAMERANRQRGHRFNYPLLTIATAPLYPIRPLTDPSKLLEIRWDIKVTHLQYSFPEPDNKHGIFAYESLIVEDSENPYSTYTEISVYGLYFAQHSLLDGRYPSEYGEKYMYLSHVLIKLALLLASGGNLYSRLGYYGPIEFNLQITKLLEFEMVTGPELGPTGKRKCRDPEIVISEVMPNLPTGEHKAEFLLRTTKKLGWAFGWDFNEEYLKKYFDRVERTN